MILMIQNHHNQHALTIILISFSKIRIILLHSMPYIFSGCIKLTNLYFGDASRCKSIIQEKQTNQKSYTIGCICNIHLQVMQSKLILTFLLD